MTTKSEVVIGHIKRLFIVIVLSNKSLTKSIKKEQDDGHEEELAMIYFGKRLM